MPLNDKASKESYFNQLDAEIRKAAKEMHDRNIVYTLFALIDSFNLSYSFLKYLFDVLTSHGSLDSSDTMQDWMETPLGGITAATTALTFIVFAMLANHFDEKNSNAVKRYIAISYRYFRDILKGTKNGLKGWYSASKVIGSLSGHDLSHLVIPIGLVLGILAAANRVWYSWMVSERKKMMKANADLLSKIKNTDDLTLEQLEEWQQKIRRQSSKLRAMAYLSAGYGGVVDGLYLYIGVFSLCSFAPPVLAVMALFSTLYFVSCVATRMYEEYEFQRKLDVSQTKIALATSGRKIELYYLKLQELSEQLALDNDAGELLTRQAELTTLFFEECKEYKANRDKLCALTSFGFTSAFLAGLRDGLAAYGAIVSILFMIGSILLLSSIPFPPLLLMSCISFGLVCLAGFITYSLISAYCQYEKKSSNEELIIAEEKLDKIRQLVKDVENQVNTLEEEKVRETINDYMNIDPAPRFVFQEIFEIIRSFFSGWPKGTKSATFAASFLKDVDANGHPVMLAIMVVSCSFHAIILALRAFCRAYGRPPIDEAPTPAKKEARPEVVISNVEENSSPSNERNRYVEPREERASNPSLLNSIHGFFHKKKSPSPILVPPSYFECLS